MGFEPLGTGDKPIVSDSQPTPEPGKMWFDTSPDDGIDWYVAVGTDWTLVAGTPEQGSDVDVSDSDVAIGRVGEN